MSRDFTQRQYFLNFKIITFMMIFALNIVHMKNWDYGKISVLTVLLVAFNLIVTQTRLIKKNHFYVKILGNFLIVNLLLFYMGGYENPSYAVFHFFMILSVSMNYPPVVGVVTMVVCFALALEKFFSGTHLINSIIINAYIYGGAFAIGYFGQLEGIRKKKLDHRVRELEALYTISKIIDHFPGTEQILENLTKIVAETLQASMCLIMLYDEEKDLLVAKAGYGLPNITLEHWVLRPGEGIEWQVMESKGRAISGDIGAFISYDHVFQGYREEKTVTAIPLFLKNKIIGTLSVYSTKDKNYSLEDIELLDMMGSRIGMILENDNLYKQLRSRAQKDGLTGLYNHKQFYERLREEIQEAKEMGHRLYLLMIDIDRFKAFNDQYGHLMGDKVLIQIAQTISRSIRDTDYAARYGGEEFAVILPNTDYETAALVAERIRENVKKAAETIEQLKKEAVELTVSIGIACYPFCTNDITNLVDIADIRMYKGKSMGGDQVVA